MGKDVDERAGKDRDRTGNGHGGRRIPMGERRLGENNPQSQTHNERQKEGADKDSNHTSGRIPNAVVPISGHLELKRWIQSKINVETGNDGPTSRFFQREMKTKGSDDDSMHLLRYPPRFPSNREAFKMLRELRT